MLYLYLYISLIIKLHQKSHISDLKPSSSSKTRATAMEERGKSIDNNFTEFNYTPCEKHPNSSSIGVCAVCLKERLVKLVCSECGEQRLSSCSCSDASSSYRNSCSTMEIGSVGRVSFLIENEKIDFPQNVNPNLKIKRKDEKSEQVIFMRRSSSSCVEVKKSNGFWRIKRLFRKKRKDFGQNGDVSDEKSEIWVSDIMGVSRSRSLCSFRGGGQNDVDEGSEYAFSSAKISDVTSGIFVDCEGRKSGFNNGEIGIDRRGFGQNRGVFPAKESDFSAMDESSFIDLKLDLSAESSSRHELCGGRTSGASDHGVGFKSESFGNGVSLASLRSKGLFGNGGGSCRVSVNERGLKRGSKSHKVWKWIFKYHPSSKKKE